MGKPELRACAVCGGMVPERDFYPYLGHTKDCPYAEQWRQDYERHFQSKDTVEARTGTQVPGVLGGRARCD
jgi:recombinational DNA repair protein (RecF pathway)